MAPLTAPDGDMLAHSVEYRLRGSVLSLCALLLFSVPSFAQDTSGRVVGRVVDAATARPLAAAQVFLEDGSVGRVTDLDGRYVLDRIPAGTHTVVVRMLGYGQKTITDVVVGAGEIVSLDITLETQAIALEGITVTAEAQRGSTAALLDERRNAASLTEAVGAQEIARRPDSDAADVAQRMTGVTVTDGKYVFVRGLGERYSQTTLNGSSLPSPEPEKEVVPLDLFPSGFLESLETQKSYTPDLPADFSGGSVKIQTRDFPDRFTVKLGISSSFNSNSQFEENFLTHVGGGRDWLGLDDGTRGQPDALQRFLGDVKSGERLPADPVQLVQIGEGLRDIQPRFAPTLGDTPLNRGFDLSIGGSKRINEDGEIGYFVAGTYSDSYTIRDDEIERKWRTSAFDPETATFATPNVDYAFNTGTRSVRWGTIGNLTFRPTITQKISFRTTVNLNTDDEAREFVGTNDEDIGGTIRNERARFVERLMLWGQLSGEHQSIGGSRLDWRLTAARANRDEPLLRETIYLQDPTSEEFFLLDFTESGRYFFSELTDDDVSAEFDWRFPFEFLAGESAVKFGASYRDRSRDFGSRRLNWRFLGSSITDLDDALEGGSIVATNPQEADEFRIDEVVEPGDVYDASDERLSGYVMFELPITETVQAIVGARVENYQLGLGSRGEVLRDLDQTDIAPSINLIISPTENFKIRAAASRTVDRPEFRELAPFQFTEATSLRQLIGEPDLESAEIVSADLRFDWFPGIGELVSIGGFYKELTDPIEQVFIAAASSAYSFQNAEDAQIFGAEFDLQLRLERFTELLEHVSFQGNVSVIDSEVNVVPGGVFLPTNETRALEGQAPYVMNVGLNYARPLGFEAGVFFNRFGERIVAAGGSGLPDILEQPRNALDATLSFPLPGGVRAKLKGTNLLDAEYLFDQSANGLTQIQRQYTTGRTFSVGLSWELR